MDRTTSTPRTPVAIRLIAALGIAWNIFGAVQWAGQSFATPAMLVAKGMTPAQAMLYAGLPGWMTTVFAIGVFAGLVACLLLLAGRRTATTLFAMSLVGYVALYIGDMMLGVFAAFGMAHVVVLSMVVAIAVGLLILALHADRRGWLR